MAKYKLSTENIDFQSNFFFKALVTQFNELLALTPEEREQDPTCLALTETIATFTGLDVTISLGDWNPCVRPPDINRNNVLINPDIKGYFQSADGARLVAEAGGMLKGTVDLKNTRVTGAFTKMKSTIYLPLKFLKNGMWTAEEWAAIMLHEIGHIFCYFLYITRTITTNQVLAGVAKSLSATNDPKEIEVIVMSAKKALQLGDLDAAKLAKVTDKKLIEISILNQSVKRSKDELGFDIYNLNSFEQLADQFAVRHGAGRHLASGLDKVYQTFGHQATRSQSMFIFVEAVKVTLLIGIVASHGLKHVIPVLGGLIGGLLSGFLYSSFLAMFAMDLNTTTYDRAGGRTKRIKEQIIEGIKSKELPPDLKEAYKEDLEVVKDLESKLTDRRQLFTVIGSYIFKDVNDRYEQERLSQELESLVSNDLFTVMQSYRKGK